MGKMILVYLLTEEYNDYTPYQFSSNQPVHAPELEGLESLATASQITACH